MVAVAIVGAAVVGGGASVYSANKAASAQTKAANTAAQASKDAQALVRSDLAPYRDIGASGTTAYGDAIGLNGADKQASQFANFRADPGYQFAMDEGLRGVQGSAAAGSLGIGGGGVLKALQRYGQGMADQQYGTYLDRFLKASTLGENAAAQTGVSGMQAAGQQGSAYMDAGAAKAGGYLSAAQGVNGAINNGLQIYGYSQGNTGGYTPPPSSVAKLPMPKF
jgi:hypothetical protein